MTDEEEVIPNRKERIANADKIGNQMYEKNWEAILHAIKQVDPKFASFIREIPYGSIYPRENLSLELREIASITALTQMNLKPQLKSHIIAARNVGISREEIKELFLHIAMYIGFPLAWDGLKIAKEVFDREDEKNQDE